MPDNSPHACLQRKVYKCRAKAIDANKRFDDKINTEDVYNLLIRFEFKCIYCLSPLSSKTWELDHFYSRAMGGKNKIDNLAPSCKWCNQMKGALDGFAFLERCKLIVNKNFIQNIGDFYKSKVSDIKQSPWLH